MVVTEHDHRLLELALAHVEAEEVPTDMEVEVRQHGYLDSLKHRLEAAERKVDEAEALQPLRRASRRLCPL